MSVTEEKETNFEESIKILKDLVDDGEVYISLIPPLDIIFEVDRDISQQYLEKYSLSEKSFQRASRRISFMLLAILNNEEDRYIDDVLEDEGLESDEKEKEKEKEKENLKKQIDVVRDSLFTNHLKNRYDLKISSKAPTFSDIDWDIKTKIRDAKLKNINFPYATCRIKYQKDTSFSPINFFSGRSSDSVQINFSIDDIEYLIRTFNTIKKHLHEIETEENGGRK